MKRIIFCFLLLIFAVGFAQAQQDCGAVDCPGRCGRFVDQNGDGFCDHGGLSAPAAVSKPAAEVKSEESPANKPSTEKNTATTAKAQKADKQNVTSNVPTAKSEASSEIVPEEEGTTLEEQPTEVEEEKPAKTKSPYSLILISAITLGLYLLTSILVKTKVMNKATHRKIWNILLLITALFSCLLGFFLVIQINYSLKMDWLWTVKLYHVQFGIAMTIIAVIHILWHVNYWKSYFRKK